MQAVLDNPAVGWTFVVYLSAMLVLGLVAYWRTRDLSDYILGGRSLSSGVTALSAGASDMSGWLLLGLPGYAYASGVETGWIALGLLVGTYLNWRLVALRLRVYTQLADNALTLPDYFERRFADPSRLLRVISAFFVLLFFLFYTSSGLVAAGKLFSAVFGMPYVWAVAAGVLSVVAYTFVGGFLAVSWTDVVQGLLMALLLSLYWPRMTRNGALAGILVGGITVVVWKQLEGGIFDLYELVPAFAFASLAVIVVSLLDKPAPSAVTEQFRQLRRAVQNGD